MNALDAIRDLYYNGQESMANKKTLALAYLQLHERNPGLHPDDRMDPECGYGGWHMLLVHKAIAELNMPDNIKYPAALYQFNRLAGPALTEFHASDDDDMFQSKVKAVIDFVEDMTVQELDATTKDLDELITYHDGAPEDVFAILTDLSDILHWVNNLQR